jgi:hypothetical protein
VQTPILSERDRTAPLLSEMRGRLPSFDKERQG